MCDQTIENWIRRRRRQAALTAPLSLVLFAASLWVPQYAAGHESDEGDEHAFEMPREVPSAEIFAPTAAPDRIVLTWVDDPSTTQAVTWRTSTEVKRAFAEIAVAQDGPYFVPEAKSSTAETTLLTLPEAEAHYHTVHFSDLEPATMYVYRVGDGANWSEWSQFTTASQDAQPFSFVYVGDAQNQVKEHWSRLIRQSYQSAPKAAFVLHAGDLVNRGDSDGEWGEWFYASSHIHRSVPCIATPGNHEYVRFQADENSPQVRIMTPHWKPTFAFPSHGPEGLEESVYWIDYQGVRIISLNSNEREEEQIPWLDGVLADNPNRWTVVTFHHPIYSPKANRDNPLLRARWQPLFDKYDVDIVLQGHDHTYARTQLMTQGDEAPPAEQNAAGGLARTEADGGVVYVVSVSGPKMYDLGLEPYMRRTAEGTQLFQVIHVNGDQLEYEARTARGLLYDHFKLTKRQGEPNELTELLPDREARERELELRREQRRAADASG